MSGVGPDIHQGRQATMVLMRKGFGEDAPGPVCWLQHGEKKRHLPPHSIIVKTKWNNSCQVLITVWHKVHAQVVISSYHSGKVKQCPILSGLVEQYRQHTKSACKLAFTGSTHKETVFPFKWEFWRKLSQITKPDLQSKREGFSSGQL